MIPESKTESRRSYAVFSSVDTGGFAVPKKMREAVLIVPRRFPNFYHHQILCGNFQEIFIILLFIIISNVIKPFIIALKYYAVYNSLKFSHGRI